MSSVITPRTSRVTIEFDVIGRDIGKDFKANKYMENIYAGLIIDGVKSSQYIRYYTTSREQREGLCSYYGLARTSHLANQSMVVYEIYYESE